MNSTHRRLLLVALLILGSGIGATIWYARYHTQVAAAPLTIMDFDTERDKSFILDIFKNDWYWLVSEHSTDFSPEYMLQNRASSKAPEHVGNLTIKVGYVDQEPVGFVAYYKKSFYDGFILFLALRSQFRSKGYAYQLLQHAINDLKSRFVTKIRLVTRTVNAPAIKLYTGIGFRETDRDDEGFVYFQYDAQR